MDIKFGYWMPQANGGFVVSDLPQRTEYSFEYNKKLIQTAEKVGFDYTLTPARYFSSHGWSEQFEAITTTAGLASYTNKIKLIAAAHPGLWHPGIIAKMGATIDHMCNGRWNINITTGFLKEEFVGFGEPWLEHGERYRRAEEFINVLKGLWTEDSFDFRGDFYQIHDAPLRPKPLANPHPEIFQGGNSTAARKMAARVSDWLLINGNTLEDTKELIETTNQYAEEAGRRSKLKYGINAFVILRDTEEEARQVYRDIVDHAPREVIERFHEQTRQAGASTSDGIGMWTNSSYEDYVQQNDGFKPDFIGTKEQIAKKMQEYHAVGIDFFLVSFLHYSDELELFGKEIIPYVRQLDSLRKEENEIPQ